MSRRLAIVLSLFFVASCGLKQIPEVPVAQQWTDTINNFSLIPIYPMRENVFVGDIRLTVSPEVLVHGQLSYRNMGQVPTISALQEFYEKRPSYPKDDGGADRGLDPKKPWKQPQSAGTIFGDEILAENTNRLRLAALPGIKVATIAQGTVGARIPLGGLGDLGGGAAARGSRILDISLVGIEEIEAPSDWKLFKSFEAHCANEHDEHAGSLSSKSIRFSLAQLLEPTGHDKDGVAVFTDTEVIRKARPQLAVISRVLYARGIDYTFKTDEGYSADIVGVLGPLKDLQALVSALGTAGTPPAAGPVAPQPEGTAALAKELAGLVSSLRSTISASASPGVAFSTVFVDARGITQRDIFERPMAFAAQAIGFDIDLNGAPERCFTVVAPAAPTHPLER